MNRPRWRKVVADLVGNPARSLLVVVSIAVGLVASGMIVILYNAVGDDMRLGYLDVNAANIQVRADAVDDDFIVHLSHLVGVKNAEGVRIFDLRIRTGQDQFKAIRFKAYDKIDETMIAQVRLVEGHWPPEDDEIVLEANRLGDTHYQVGDDVEIKLADGSTQSLKLVAIVHDQTIGADGGGAGFFLAPIQGYVTRDTLTRLGQPDALNAVLLTVDQNNEDLTYIQSVADRVVTEFERYGTQTTSTVVRRSEDHPNAPYVEAVKAVLYLLSFLVLFLSAFLIINTLSALLTHQIEQIGVMKTVGATRSALVGIYLALVAVYSLIGLLLAIPLANLTAFAELVSLAPALNFISRGFRIVPQAILVQSLIALIVPQVASLIPVLRGTRLPIQQALQGSSENAQKIDPITQWLSHIRAVSRPLAISLRNTFRQRLRLVLTLITLALGGAIFIGTFNMRASLESYITRLGRYFIADINVTLNQPYRVDRVKADILQLPGVARVEGWASGTGQMIEANGKVGESVQIQGPPADTQLVEPIVISGRWLLPGDQNAVALNEYFMEQYPGVQPGDQITLRIDGKDSHWTVVGFYQFAGKNIGITAFTNYDSLARVTHTYGKSVDIRVVSTNSAMTLTQQEDFAQQVESELTAMGYKVRETRAGKSLRSRTSGGLDALTNFLLFLAMLMAVVGSIGLAGTMSLNVMDRTREIGVMRAIGARDGEIHKIVVVEGIIIGLISWVISTLAALPVSQGLSEAIGESIFGAPLPFQYVMTGPAIWFGVILVFSLVASILPARNAVRLTIREILAYE